MIRFACPTCSAIFRTTDDQAGRTSTCTKCRNVFLIPDAPATLPVAKAVPVMDAIVVETGDEPKRPRHHRDEEDDYEVKPRRKKNTLIGIAIGVGAGFILFALLIAGISISDAASFKNPLAQMNAEMKRVGMTRAQLPANIRTNLTQIEIAIVFLQIFMYGSILAALAWFAGGIGLILQLKVGRVVAIAAAGLSVLMVLALLVMVIMLGTLEAAKGNAPPPTIRTYSGNLVLRFGMHVLPVAVAASTLFLKPMQKLKRSF